MKKKTYFLDWQTCSSTESTRKDCVGAQCAAYVQRDQARRQPEGAAVAAPAGLGPAVVAVAAGP